MDNNSSFAPILSTTRTLSATNASGNVALLAGRQPTGPFQMRIYNAGTDLVFVNFGNGSSTAAVVATDMPVPSGAIEVITLTNTLASPVTYAAAICASTTATVYFTPGYGI